MKARPNLTVFDTTAIASLGRSHRVPVGAKIEVVGYFSHKSQETDRDLQVYLIDHHGAYVVIEAPRKFKSMKWEIRNLHFHRGDVVVARGTLTRQFDKPTFRYKAGWMEIQPVETIDFYSGPLPADLEYKRVTHPLIGMRKLGRGAPAVAAKTCLRRDREDLSSRRHLGRVALTDPIDGF